MEVFHIYRHRTLYKWTFIHKNKLHINSNIIRITKAPEVIDVNTYEKSTINMEWNMYNNVFEKPGKT